MNERRVFGQCRLSRKRGKVHTKMDSRRDRAEHTAGEENTIGSVRGVQEQSTIPRLARVLGIRSLSVHMRLRQPLSALLPAITRSVQSLSVFQV